MNIFKGFGYGTAAYSKAMKLLFNKGLAWFLLFPLLLNILLFIIGTEFIGGIAADLKQLTDNYVASLDIDFLKNETVRTTIGILIGIILKIAYFLAFAFAGGYIIVAVMSPVFSILSEKTETLLTGKKYDFSFIQLLKDVLRGVMIVIRNLALEILISIVLFFCGFIPLIGLAAPVVLFLVSSYFYGFSFLDYAIERRKMNVSDSVKYMRRNKGIVIGNGFIFAISLLVPFCGVMISGFVAIISVIAGTIAVVEYSDR